MDYDPNDGYDDPPPLDGPFPLAANSSEYNINLLADICASRLTSGPSNSGIYKPKFHYKLNNPLPYKNIDDNNNNQPLDLSIKQAPLPSKRRRTTSDLQRQQVAVTLPTIPPVGQSDLEKFKQSVPLHLPSGESFFLPPGTTIVGPLRSVAQQPEPPSTLCPIPRGLQLQNSSDSHPPLCSSLPVSSAIAPSYPRQPQLQPSRMSPPTPAGLSGNLSYRGQSGLTFKHVPYYSPHLPLTFDQQLQIAHSSSRSRLDDLDSSSHRSIAVPPVTYANTGNPQAPSRKRRGRPKLTPISSLATQPALNFYNPPPFPPTQIQQPNQHSQASAIVSSARPPSAHRLQISSNSRSAIAHSRTASSSSTLAARVPLPSFSSSFTTSLTTSFTTSFHSVSQYSSIPFEGKTLSNVILI